MSKKLKILQTNNMKKSSFVFGATVLAISGVLCKVLGAVYKVPLANMLKTEGIGIYYLVFPIYSLFLTLSSSCFPTVISRFVANAKAENKHKLSNKIFVASLIILVVLGFVLGLIMLIFSILKSTVLDKINITKNTTVKPARMYSLFLTPG